ncbi:DUF1707 domain-containing protein [uncultured Friedmanniella sp.]|uniref:DUF1707 SHOCT-like domain-containing protein n=1 Tax=uncultured Friedmanniella sp. TaxID=335381 RepID=UPI0035C9A3F5
MDSSRPLVPLPTTALHQRAGDADRSAVCDQLSTHFAAGRLSPEDLDARLSAAMTAGTVLDLRRLLQDLPLAPAPGLAPARPPTSGAGWNVLDVLALLAVIGCLAVAAVAILGLGINGQSALLVAGFAGGCVAALGGAALAHLVHRGVAALGR